MLKLSTFLENQGVITGFLMLAVVFLWVMYHRNMSARLSDKDKEIDRLAEDVKDMRDRMMKLWDNRQ